MIDTDQETGSMNPMIKYANIIVQQKFDFLPSIIPLFLHPQNDLIKDSRNHELGKKTNVATLQITLNNNYPHNFPNTITPLKLTNVNMILRITT